VGGSYVGHDPFGLWWSAGPDRGEAPLRTGLGPVPVTVTVEEAGTVVSAGGLCRRWIGTRVEVTDLDEDGLVGLSFRPAGPGPFPAVMVLGGSTGGLGGADAKAALLASRGIAALAVAYFAAEGRPPDLVDIPLEDLGAGLAWLRRRPHVDPERVGVLGSSRGGELALLLGATLRGIRCVVAGAPSSVVWGGAGRGAAPGSAAWTFGGRRLSTMPPWLPERAAGVYAGDPVRLEPLFAEVLDDRQAVRAAEIAVERVGAPVLLVSGGDDALWPSARMAEAIERRASCARTATRVRHLHYPAAGHLCATPPGTILPPTIVHPLDGRRYLMGGTAAANAAAAADSWARTLHFLRAMGSS